MRNLLATLCLSFSLVLQAQDSMDSIKRDIKVQPSLIEFNGGLYNGNTAEVAAPAGLVEDAIKEKFKLMGLKPKEIKGFMVFRNARLEKIDPLNPIDVFVKVERKGKRENEISVVSLIVTPADQISNDKLKSGIATATVTSAALTGVFFSEVSPEIDYKVFEKNVADQQDVVKKAEKKLKDLQDDQKSAENKIKNLQEELAGNRRDQELQAQELEKKRTSLNLLLSRKPNGAIPAKD